MRGTRGALVKVAEAPTISSALYEGTLSHLRLGPGPHHRFERRVAMPLLFLDELELLDAQSRWLSISHRAPIRFRRDDFLGRTDGSLEDEVRDQLRAAGYEPPAGRIALLANLRTFGWLFNPLSLYFAHDTHGAVDALVADVENTPWNERHAYVVGRPGVHHFDKAFHVSPFLPMELRYRLEYTEPGDRLVVRLDALDGEERRFTALLRLTRTSPLDAQGIRRLLLRHPLGAQRVSTGIYAHAARLALKRTPYFKHPDRRDESTSSTDSPQPDIAR